MLPHARDTERVGGRADRYHDSVVRQLKFVNGTLTPLADHGLADDHFSFHIYCGSSRLDVRRVLVQASDGCVMERYSTVPTAAPASIGVNRK